MTRHIVNEDVRPDMLQEIAGLLQKLTEKAPGIYNFARLIGFGIGWIEVFCEHPATCPPDVPIGKEKEGEAPTRSMIISDLYCLQVRYKELTIRGAW